MCGNMPPRFNPLDNRGDRTNQLQWLELLHIWISLLTQAGKNRVFYSVDEMFESGTDPRNILDKQVLKIWTPCLSAFYRVIPRDFGVEFESSKSPCARLKKL